jgi:hypothetical protein
MRRHSNQADDGLVPASEEIDKIRRLVVSESARMHIVHLRMVAGLLGTNLNDHGSLR